MASNTIIEKYPLYNLGISGEEVEHTLKNSAQKADVDALQERINKIKYYVDADIEISPDEWFVFNDEEHTILGGFSEGHENETSIVIPYSVTTIDDSAFYNCESLTSVTMPNSVTTIRRQAFGNCTHLTSVTISDGVTSIGDDAFRGCSSLTNVIIPNSVRSIGDAAFIDCISLTSVEIPDSVTSIGKLAFFGCTSLTSVIVPDRVTSIGEWTFRGCRSLTNITIGNSVTSIGDNVFVGCRSLINITVNSGNKNYVSVDGNLFDKNQEILIQYAVGKQDTQYIIPNSVRIIIDNAFTYGYSLTSITVSNNVTSIGEYAFTACSSLTDIYYDGTLEEWNAIVPDHLGIAKSTKIHTLIAKGTCGDNLTWTLNEDYELVIDGTGGMYDWTYEATPWRDYDNSIKTIIINSGVTLIGHEAFRGCDSLTSVTIPDSVTYIGYFAFSGCSSLTSVTIPNSVGAIGVFAFSGCESLTNIIIPDRVPRIDGDTFSGCTSLTSINIPNSVTWICDVAFDGCTNLTIYCEQGSYAGTFACENNIPVMYTDISKTTLDAKANAADVYTKTEMDSKISTVYKIKGSSTIANLPTNPEVGDVYNITDSGTITGTEIVVSIGDNIVYTSEGWDKLAATVDLSGYQEKLIFDTTPTEGSTNPVTSGGIKEYIIETTAEDIDNWIGNSDTTSVVGEATAGNAIVGI